MSLPPPLRLDDRAIDLGPRLPVAAYHAVERWHPDRIGAVAVYCSDGRWGEAMDEFCHRHLQIPRYDRWAVPGGPAWVAARPHDPAVRAQLDFLVRAHELERVVLITHYGCAWYGHRLGRSPDECLPAQGADLAAAAAALRAWFPGMQVDAYVAVQQHGWVTFHRSGNDSCSSSASS
jgi:hypothetical protein